MFINLSKIELGKRTGYDNWEKKKIEEGSVYFNIREEGV